MSSERASRGYIYSSLTDDPEMAELVAMFVDEISDRMASLKDSFMTGRLDVLRRTAHQLKGAAGSYGFDIVTKWAAQLKANIRDEASEELVRDALHELISVCERMRCRAEVGAAPIRSPSKARAGRQKAVARSNPKKNFAPIHPQED